MSETDPAGDFERFGGFAGFEEARLDGLETPENALARDPSGMLREIAGSAAQLRAATAAAVDAGVGRLTGEGRPRALLVAGMGGSGVAGDVLHAVAGRGCPVPVLGCKDYLLPGWAGVSDVVLAVSCSGGTEETLAVVDEAARRGCQVIAVGAPGSPLAQRAAQLGAPFLPVRSTGQPRATLWALSMPVLLAASALGLLTLSPSDIEAAASRLEQVAQACRPGSEIFVNPAKTLAGELAGRVPMIWGTTPVASTAAYRLCCQLNENAKYPAIYGSLPEANHNQVVAFDGVFGSVGRGGDDDLFADPSERAGGPGSLRLVLLRDPVEEHPQVARRAAISREIAEGRGVAVTELVATGEGRLERLASLVGLADFATTYLALGYGLDPTPVAAIGDLKSRIARP